MNFSLNFQGENKMFSYFFSCIFISWRLITLQYCSGFCHTLTWISHGFTCVPHPNPPSHLPPHPIPLGPFQCTRPEHLSYASILGWRSVSPLTVYLFQCYSLRSSHPRLLPQNPKVCSIYLCLFFCFAYRVTVTIFLNSIYMYKYTVLVFIFLAYFSLLNGAKWAESQDGKDLVINKIRPRVNSQ